MRIATALVLNAALLAVLLRWLGRQWQWAAPGGWRWVLGLGLALRLGVGVGRNVPLRLDAKYMSFVSDLVTEKLRAQPASAGQLLTQAVTIFPTPYIGDIVYQNSSNTWILIKILALLNVASLGHGWLNALYLSVFAFVGCWQLVRVLADRFPHTPPGAGVLAFLFWPSVWFWATGISKEAVLLGSGAWLTALVLSRLYGGPASQNQSGLVQGRWWVGLLGLAALHFAMRYFMALPLLAGLAGLALGRVLECHRLLPRRWAAVVGLVAVLSLGIWVAPQVSVAFRPNKFINQVVRVYSFELEHSVGRPHFEYPCLRPTGESLAAHAPLAVANALARPWLGEATQPMYVLASLENLALLLLMALAIGAIWRGPRGHLPFGVVLALGIFCLAGLFLMGLTTPNLGSLNRYRSGLIPFLVLLLLQQGYGAAALRRLRLTRDPASARPTPDNQPHPATA